MDYPQLFAAIAPLCGRVVPLRVGQLWKTPTWVFHGALDDVVPIAGSREMVDYLRGMNNPDVRYTEYPDLGHEIWGRAYSDPKLYDWLLTHRLPEAKKPPHQP